MNCNFCNMNLEISDRSVDDGQFTPIIYIDIDKNGEYILVAYADSETHMKINNCPVCGRKLKFMSYI